MRYFSVNEANEALRAVRPLAERLVTIAEQLGVDRAEAASLAARIAGNGAGGSHAAALSRAQQRVAELAREAGELVARIEDLGAQVKDLELGLVDFPARRGTETVLLCWKVGEGAIEFWHGLEEGYAGRKPLPL